MFNINTLYIARKRILQHPFQSSCLSLAIKLCSQAPFYISLELWRGIKYKSCAIADDRNFFKIFGENGLMK